MIRTDYDPEADVLHVAFGPLGAAYDGAEKMAPGLFVAFDAAGNAVGTEVLGIALRTAGHYGEQASAAAE